MFFLFLLFIVFLVFYGYLTLEEETLIILASVFWLDAAGSFIKELLDSELKYKGEVIKESYVYFLELKKSSLFSLLKLHKYRGDSIHVLDYPLREFILSRLLQKSIKNYFFYSYILSRYAERTDIVDNGLVLINSFCVKELESILELVDKEFIDIK